MQNRKWLSVLISVVVSIGLWVYVVTVENPVQELELHNIPVTLSGQDLLREDYDLLITDSNIEGGVSLTFSGKYSDLRKLRENRDQLQLTISVTHLAQAQTLTSVQELLKRARKRSLTLLRALTWYLSPPVWAAEPEPVLLPLLLRSLAIWAFLPLVS